MLRKSREAMLNLVSLCHLPYMLPEASNTKSILDKGFGFSFSGFPCENMRKQGKRSNARISFSFFKGLDLIIT
jgi:hypothetical protein